MFGLFKKTEYNFERAIQWYQLIEPRINVARQARNTGEIDLKTVYNRNKGICLETYKIMSNQDLREIIEDVKALLSFKFQQVYQFPIDPVAYEILKSSRDVAKKLL